jgi:hypothetical protein
MYVSVPVISFQQPASLMNGIFLALLLVENRAPQGQT